MGKGCKSRLHGSAFKSYKGKTIREVLREAFDYLFNLEKEMNDLYTKMGEVSQEEMEKC